MREEEREGNRVKGEGNKEERRKRMRQEEREGNGVKGEGGGN